MRELMPQEGHEAPSGVGKLGDQLELTHVSAGVAAEL
jgi:hypothetical protein